MSQIDIPADEYPREILRLWVPGPIPGMEDIIQACKNHRGQWNAYMTMKTTWGDRIATMAFIQKFPKFERGHFTYLFVEQNRRRDPSNVIAGGIKLIEDALRVADLLPNDGWAHVLSIRPYFTVVEGGAAATCGAALFVTQDESLTFEESIGETAAIRRWHHAGLAQARADLPVPPRTPRKTTGLRRAVWDR